MNEQLRREVGFLRHRMLTAKKRALLYQSDNITLSERIHDLEGDLRASVASLQSREQELKRRAEEYAENLLLLRELSEQRKIDPQSVSKYIMDPQVIIIIATIWIHGIII